MHVRVLAPLRLAALAGLVLALTALVPTSAFAQAPCRSPIPPGTYAGSMDGTLSMRGSTRQTGTDGYLAMEYRQRSDDLLLMIDCDASISGHGTLRLDLEMTFEGAGDARADTPQNFDINGAGEFAVDVDGYAVRQPGKEPLLVLTFYPVTGSGEGAVQTTYQQPKRRFDVALTVHFDVEDLDELLQGEGVPFPLQIGSQSDGVLTGEVFGPEITDLLSEAFQGGFSGSSFGTGTPDDVQISTSGSWRLALLSK